MRRLHMKMPAPRFHSTKLANGAGHLLNTIRKAPFLPRPKLAIAPAAHNLPKLPQAQITRTQKILNNLTTLKSKFHKLDNNKLTVDDAKRIAASDPAINAAVKQVGRRITNRALVGLTTTIATTAILGTGAWAVIDVYRQAMSGCFRYEVMPDGSVSVCKVMSLSCNEGTKLPEKNIPVCQQSVLTPYQQTGKCPDNNTEIQAFKCGSNITDASNPNYIADRDLIPENIFFRCTDATFAEALADLSVDLASVIKSAAVNTVSIFKYVIYVIMVVVMLGAIIGILFVYGRMKKMASAVGDDDDDDSQTTKGNPQPPNIPYNKLK